FFFAEIDGTDVIASYVAMKKAVEHIRSGKGPAFIHGHVIRPYSHSLSDDERLYRPEVERQKDAARDPIAKFQMFLIREGILDEEGINRLEKQVDEEVTAAADEALAATLAQPSTIYDHVYSPGLDPTSPKFESKPATEGAAKTM